MRIAAIAAVLAAAALAGAQPEPGLRARYTKQEVAIPMRDGVTLFTSIYAPVDTSRPVPILMQRTPYGVDPYGAGAYRRSLGPSPAFERDGYIFVYQDVRGRFKSGGEFVEMRPARQGSGPHDVDEGTDTHDTIAWLLQSGLAHNGRVGLWGVSYPGFYAAAALPGGHPAIKAASPQAPIADLYMGDDSYHNGAFMLAANFSFYSSFFPRAGGPGTGSGPAVRVDARDGYAFYLAFGGLAEGAARHWPRPNAYWDDNLAHTTYDDFWQRRALQDRLDGVSAAVLTVGGWYDAEDPAGPLRVYRAIERRNPGASNRLVMGPWTHGGWSRGTGDRLGALSFGTHTAETYRERFEHPFFEHHLRGAPLAESPEAAVFVTGRDAWRTFDAWPPAGSRPRTWYLAPDGALREGGPGETGTGATRSTTFDEYVSDPARPVPYVPNAPVDMRRDYMVEDQRFTAARPDVLVYRTPPLAEDLTIAGPIAVSLEVSTTGTDADFVVKLIDAHPDDARAPTGAGGRPLPGFQRLVRGEPFRGKFRRSFQTPVPFEPGRRDRLAFEMPDVAHTFRRGHRLMIHVQSSWFPLVDRNPQVFMDIPKARAADFRPATHRVWHTAASSIRLLTVPGGR